MFNNIWPTGNEKKRDENRENVKTEKSSQKSLDGKNKTEKSRQQNQENIREKKQRSKLVGPFSVGCLILIISDVIPINFVDAQIMCTLKYCNLLRA